MAGTCTSWLECRASAPQRNQPTTSAIRDSDDGDLKSRDVTHPVTGARPAFVLS
jgi:hypothetical protein